MAPCLSVGCLQKILNGEDVLNPVIQILEYKRCRTAGNPGKSDRYRLLISDGDIIYSYVTLGTVLNQMLVDKELEKFTVVEVEKYACLEVNSGCKVIFLLDLTVLAPGSKVNKKVGNPIVYTAGSSNQKPLENGTSVHPSAKPLFHPDQNPTSPSKSEVDETIQTSFKTPTEKTGTESKTGTISTTEMIKFLNLERYTMVPSLSSGFINKILNGEDVTNAVFQVIDFVKIPGAKKVRHQLMISDGVVSSSFFILGTKLNHMVEKKELEKLDVIRVDRYACNQNQADRKVITLLSLIVLVPGSEINKILGNPVNSNTVPSSTARPSEKETVHAGDSTLS